MNDTIIQSIETEGENVIKNQRIWSLHTYYICAYVIIYLMESKLCDHWYLDN